MSNIFSYLVRETGGVIPLNVGTGAPVPANFSQGLILDDTSAVYAALGGVADHYNAGLPFDEYGRLLIEQASPSYVDQSIPFTSSGFVAIGDGSSGGYFGQGLLYGPDGGLVGTGLTPPISPPLVWGPLSPRWLNSGGNAFFDDFQAVAGFTTGEWVAGIPSDGWCALTQDNGAVWTQLPQGLGQGDNLGSSLAADEATGVMVCGGAFGFASRSVDKGVTWSNLPRGLGMTSDQFPLNGLATDNAGVWWCGAFGNSTSSRSSNNGATWVGQPNFTLHTSATQCNSIACDGIVWMAGFDSGRASVSLDGVVWSDMLTSLNSGSANQLVRAIQTNGNGTWVASFADGYASRSTDAGVTWTALPRYLGMVAGAIGQTLTASGDVWLVGGTVGYAAYSIDDGLTWTALTRGLESGGLTNINSVYTPDGITWIAVFSDGWGAISPALPTGAFSSGFNEGFGL